MNIEHMPAHLTTSEVAAVSRKSQRTIRNRVYLGLEPRPVRVGGRLLFPRESVARFLRGEMDAQPASRSPKPAAPR